MEEGEVFPQQLQSELSVHINSFLVSFEAVFLTYFVWKHFRIRSAGEDHYEVDGDGYDELHDGIVAHVREGKRENYAKKS